MKIVMTSSLKNTNRQEVSFLIDGNIIKKSITKYTTCADVINKFPRRDTPIAVFESVDGEEKELPGKTKLLKAWRSHGLTKELMFVIRKSDQSAKPKKNSRKLFSSKPKCDKPKAKVAQGKSLSKDTLKKVSDLAFYVRYQKAKLQTFNNKSSTVKDSEQKKLMKKLTSKASLNSMDAFLAKTDLDEMARFLDFCGEVTAEKLGNNTAKKVGLNKPEAKSPSLDKDSEGNQSIKKMSTFGFHLSLKNKKLGLKQRFAPKQKVVERTVSTGTINSTDTGYHSVGSDGERSESVSTSVEAEQPKRRTTLLPSDISAPRHSTPLGHGRHRPATQASSMDLTLEHDDTTNELHGKTMLMQKFMADHSSTTENIKSDKMKLRDSQTFDNLEDKCRFYWETNCDSDSDSESEMSEPCEDLDVAFIDNRSEVLPPFSNLKVLRRESAISNLNNLSLLNKDLGLKTLNGTYDFDCSFPRMDDTQDFSCDFTYSFDETDSEDEFMNNSDDRMDSFMNSREITLSNDADEMDTSFVPCDGDIEMIV
ncbi:hypothetical protein ACF0H5_015281 [Mactra antiquata]